MSRPTTAVDSLGLFQNLFENSADAYLIIEKGIFSECNQATVKMLRARDRNQVLATHPSQLSPPFQPDGRDSMEKADEMIRIAIERGSNRFEWMHRRVDGEDFPVEVLLTPIKTGDRLLVFTVWREIAERQRSEAAVREWRERYDLLSTASGQMVYDYDMPTGQIVWSQSVEDLLGFKLDEMNGGVNQWIDLIHPEDRSVALAAHDAAQSQLTRYDVEYRYRRKDGSYLWVSDRGLFMADSDGVPVRMLGLMADISRRRDLEAEIRSSLQRRGSQVQITTQIAQDIAAASDLRALFERVVTLVKERLGYYHTQILRYDASQDAVALVAGYGRTGAKMLAAGHRMPVGVGLIGTAAASGQTVLRPSLVQDPDWRPNPLLPETRGEIAVPIKLRDQVLGVLDVQSDQAEALGPDDQLMLEGLCGQIAVAMESTRLRQEMAERLQELAAIYRTTSHEGWLNYLSGPGAGGVGFVYDLVDVENLAESGSAAQPGGNGHTAAGETGQNPDLATENRPVEAAELQPHQVMLEVRGESIGALGVYEDPGRPLSDEERLLIEQVSDQVAQALESARLFSQTQQALEDTQGMYEGSARVIAAQSLEQVLQALVGASALSNLDTAIIKLFDQSWETEPPNWVNNAAVWERTGGYSREPVGTNYPFKEFPTLQLMRRSAPLVIRDVLADPRSDANERAFLVEKLNIRGVIFWPLAAGGQWFGALAGQSAEPIDLGEDQIRRITSLAGQAAAVIQSLRLQEVMRERLRELTALQRMLSREAWLSYRAQSSTEALGYHYDHFAARPLSADLAAELFPAAALGPGNIGNDRVIALPASTSASPSAVELTVRGEPIGLLGLSPEAGVTLSQDDQDFLEAVSEQIAQALERARLIEQTQKSAVELQAVAEVGTATATILEPEQLLQQVVDLTRERFGLYHAHVYLLDPDSGYLVLAAGAGQVGREMRAEGWSIPFDQPESLVAGVARQREGRIINDVRTATGYLPNPLLPETRAELAVPMIIGDHLLGVFDVQSELAGRFSSNDLRTYTTLAAQVSVALQNANIYAEQLATVERLRELDNMKSAFLANMSHELRTPLNSILGFTQVVLEGLDGDLTELMVSDLELIEKNGKHLLNLINDILDMAKIEAGRLTLSPEPMSIYDLMDEVIITSAALARERGLFMNLDADSDADWMVMADSVRLRQIFINLIGNSIKFTEHGGITVELERIIQSAVTGGEAVQIRIVDSGIGIQPDKLEEIFEAFSQVDSSTTRKVGGTGLGLPISRRLVEMHGGRLWAESGGLGLGSTFVLELPVGKTAGSA